jgi:hypothetical protein
MKKTMPWKVGYVVIVALSLDFWNWGRTEPLILGVPYWVVAFILLNLALSAFYMSFAANAWGD